MATGILRETRGISISGHCRAHCFGIIIDEATPGSHRFRLPGLKARGLPAKLVLMTEESIGNVVKKGGGFFVVLGILALVLGFASMGAPLMTGLAVTILIGSLLLVNGIM